MTKSAKTGLICTKYTYSFYHIYPFLCVDYTISVSLLNSSRKFCVYDEIFDKVFMLGKRVIKFERLKISQILRADKTRFLQTQSQLRK